MTGTDSCCWSGKIQLKRSTFCLQWKYSSIYYGKVKTLPSKLQYITSIWNYNNQSWDKKLQCQPLGQIFHNSSSKTVPSQIIKEINPFKDTQFNFIKLSLDQYIPGYTITFKFFVLLHKGSLGKCLTKHINIQHNNLNSFTYLFLPLEEEKSRNDKCEEKKGEKKKEKRGNRRELQN